MYPENLTYTSEHEWVRTPGDTEGSVRVGITDFAQDALGDIVYVSLPQVGDQVTAGDTCGELESTKSVSDIYAPVTGEIVATNGCPRLHPRAGQQRPLRGRVAVRGVRRRQLAARRPDGRRGVPGRPRGLSRTTCRSVFPDRPPSPPAGW